MDTVEDDLDIIMVVVFYCVRKRKMDGISVLKRGFGLGFLYSYIYLWEYLLFSSRRVFYPEQNLNPVAKGITKRNTATFECDLPGTWRAWTRETRICILVRCLDLRGFGRHHVCNTTCRPFLVLVSML